MKHPSRRFVWTLVALLVVGLALLGLWVRMLPKPPRTPSPDVWERAGAQGDLRTSPDGPPVTGWVYIGNDGGLSARSGRKPFLVIVPEGREKPSSFERIRSRVTGEPWGPVDARHLYQTGTPVTTPTGQWHKYSVNWWKRPTPAAK